MADTNAPSRLDKLESVYDLAIEQLMMFCGEGNKDAGTFSSCLPRIKQCLDIERAEQGATVNTSLLIRFSNNKSEALDDPAAEQSPNQLKTEEVEGLETEEVEGLGYEDDIEKLNISDEEKEDLRRTIKEFEKT